jgi:hypothetical protein
MQNTTRTLHYVFATLAFAIALTTYLLTVQPTVPFWECGEFTAASVQQQVPHPPGAPLFLMIGKVFHLLPFGDPGWRVNLVSVFASALTVLLLYLITERVIKHYFKEDLNEVGNAVLVYGSSLVAALTYTFSDTFWFNAVESEVYAASGLFVALIAWLMMIWSDKADEPGNEKYLLLIAYVMGISIGVHLLSILTIFSLVLLIYLRKYPFSIKGLAITMVVGLMTFYVIYNLVIMKFPAFMAGTLPFFKSDANEYPVTDSFLVTLLGLAAIGAAGWAVWYGRKTNHGVLALTASSFLLIMIGYSSYAHILIRANSNPPMNENKPDSFEKLVSYLGREQYGEAPSWPRRYQAEDRFIRNYVKYGKWTRPPMKVVTRKDGLRFQRPDYSAWNADTKAELGYLWDYQIDHMYIRYFLWNFMGRVSDVQDAPAYSPLTSQSIVERWNHKSGFGDRFPTNLWAVPLLLGMIGLYVHFAKDKKMAWVYLVLFLMTGVLAAIQQNQQNPQPRERDYFYIASFMIWAMWVGLGVFGILERVRKNTAMVGGGVLAALALAPFNMAMENWGTHTRAGNYLAFDYAYNILQSVEKDAIIFTNGDNDTFPVWYLQDVAGVRRDVRIVNLSLGQTTWYVEQLKNREPFGAKKLPLTFSDESLMLPEDDPKALSYDFGPGVNLEIPVDKNILAQYTTDPMIIDGGVMRFTFKGRPRGQEQNGEPSYFFGVQHKLVRDILEQVRFTRPIYFSTSVGDPSWADEYVGLDNYLRLEGMCFRVCPAPQRSSVGEGINEQVTEASLMQTLDGDEVYTEPHFGLKFRNLGGGETYYDDVHRGYISNYRNIFYKYATYLMYDKGDKAHAARVLARMNEKLSLDRFPIGIGFELQLAKFFETCGDRKNAEAMATRALASAETLMKKPALKEMEPQMQDNLVPERAAAEACVTLGRWDEARNYYKSFARGATNDPLLMYMIDEIDILKLERSGDLKGALAAAEALQAKYPVATADQRLGQAGAELLRKISELRQKMGVALVPDSSLRTQ